MDIKKLSQKEIIELIEGDGKIMDFRIKYDNLPVWPLIRAHALAAIDEYNTNESAISSNKSEGSLIKKLSSIFDRVFELLIICVKSKIFNRGKLSERDVLVFPNRNFLRDNVVHETIFGYFIQDKDNTLLMKYYDNKYRWYESEADTIFREGFFSFAYIIDDLLGRKKNKRDIAVAKDVADFISERICIDAPNIRNVIEERVSKLSNYVKQRERVLEYVCRRTRPKYIIMSEASWSYYATECHFFRKKGIPVFEIAHAMIYDGHRSYYFADGTFNNEEYKLFLPDMLAVWSEYCEKATHINTKVKCVCNPEFYYSYNRDFVACKKNLYKKKLVLYNVNCLPYEIPKIDEFIDEFSSLAGEEYLLVLRFHPLNRDYREHFEKFTEKYNVAIDDSEGIYCALAKCDYLISDFSTIVYEALACGVRVFTDDRESFIDENLLGEIECFSSVDELLGLIETEGKYVDSDMYKTLFFGEDKDVVDLYEVYVQSNQNVAV